MAIDLREKLCEGLCLYYKPSRDAELSCMGFIVVKRLIEKGREINFHRSEGGLAISTESLLIEAMCRNCPFYENDCDFAAGKRSVSACGGFMLLGHLFEEGIISIAEIKEAE